MTAETNKPVSLGRRIVRASLMVGAAHLLFKLAGLIQATAMARFVDGAVYDVVYAVAFEACIFSIFLIGEEVIGPTFLPLFMRLLDTEDESAAWRFANTVLTLHILVLALVVAAVAAFPELIVRICTSWTAVSAPDRFALASDSVARLAPALIGLSVGSTTYMILNGYKRFFLAALGDASWKFCVFLFVLAGMGFAGAGHRMIVFGVIAGSAAKLLTHLLGMPDKLRRFRPRLALRDPDLRRLALLMLPLILGIVFAKVRDVFNNVYVLSTIDTAGLMQANSFGRKLYVAVGWLVPYAISIAVFPFFCEMVDRDDREQFGRVLSSAARMLLSVFIPVACVCAVLAEPVTSLLFYGGKFDAESVRWTSASMACYTLVLPAYAIEYLLMQAFFANRRMISVTVTGIVFTFVSMAISYAGIVVFGARGVYALVVIALGFTFSRVLKSTTLIVLLKKNVSFFAPAETASFLARALVVGLISAGMSLAAAWAFEQTVTASDAKLALAAKLALCGAAAGLGFIAGVKALRVKEPEEMLRWTLARVKEKAGKARRNGGNGGRPGAEP